MKHLFWTITLALLPLGLSAQTKSTVRKPVSQVKKTTYTRAASTKTAAAPTKKVLPAVATPSESATTVPTPVVAQAQPVQTVLVANTRPATTSRPATPATVKISHFRIGVRAGGNLSTIGGISASADGASVQLARVMGFHGGLVVNIGGPTFSVQPRNSPQSIRHPIKCRFGLCTDKIQLGRSAAAFESIVLVGPIFASLSTLVPLQHLP